MGSDEADVLARARRGDRAAFGELVRTYQRRVYATAYHIMGSHADADDVVQDAFVRAFRAIDGFDGRSELFTWLYRITVNTALNHLRSKRRATALHDSATADAEAQHHEPRTPKEWTVLSDQVRRVLGALEQLSPTLRVTLVLATVEGMQYKEIAELLEIPEGTVAWRINEARKKLKIMCSD